MLGPAQAKIAGAGGVRWRFGVGRTLPGVEQSGEVQGGLSVDTAACAAQAEIFRVTGTKLDMLAMDQLNQRAPVEQRQGRGVAARFGFGERSAGNVIGH